MGGLVGGTDPARSWESGGSTLVATEADAVGLDEDEDDGVEDDGVEDDDPLPDAPEPFLDSVFVSVLVSAFVAPDNESSAVPSSASVTENPASEI